MIRMMNELKGVRITMKLMNGNIISESGLDALAAQK